MSKVGNLFVGNQLFCGVAEHLGAPLPPVGLGVGPTKIRGAGFIAGPLLVGDPFTFTKGPNVNEANLMVARCGNPEALPPPPSILKVSSLGFPPTPIDIMLGAPEGPVGITCFCGPQPFLVQSAAIELITLNYNLLAPFMTRIGASQDIGMKFFAGAKSDAGIDWNLSAAFNAAPIIGADAFSNFADFFSPVASLNALQAEKKPFDIPHPTKDGWRLRYVCVEGPTADVYIKGKLIDSNIIELPDYWRNLVDPETITISLTPFGSYQELFVEKIEWGTKIIVKNNAGGAINCHYVVYGERVDTEKNIPEYEGTWDDYPGDNSKYATEGSSSAIKYK